MNKVQGALPLQQCLSLSLSLSFLKSFGLEVANDNANLNEQFGLSKGDLNVDDQESVYLTKGNSLLVFLLHFFIVCFIFQR